MVGGGKLNLTLTARRNQAWGEDRHELRKQFEMNVAMRAMDNPTVPRTELEQIERDAQADQIREQRKG